ncbi:MAG: MBL fold metallo-hydrolase [Anaerolineales bacterium]|nr:MBL fold metallo-hydrolase [Anaerolineales bacterium]
MSTWLSFLGAARTVTGSRFLLQNDTERVLVDCGLFQGGRKMKALNWEPFPAEPASLDAILLTHAHIDHTGYLPRLVSEGFDGPIYATQATCALLELLLPDAAYLQEQDAAYANKTGYSRHKPALPLFTSIDARDTLELLHPVDDDESINIGTLSASWMRSGHILGAGILQLDVNGQSESRRIVFSGDLGRYDSEIMKPPEQVGRADILLVESTYGGRLHTDDSIRSVLIDFLNDVADEKSVLLIPAFAIGRTQQILFWIRKLQDEGSVPDLPVFIDSPMAVEASHIYCQFGDDHNLDVNLLMDERQCPLRCKETHFIKEVEESKELNTRPGPAIIISASGMCTGGRILHHLKWRLPDRRNRVLFIGYQAEGTRGRHLLNGKRSIRIHGKSVPVHAGIAQLDALSAHADMNELITWITGFQHQPSDIFIVHGELESSRALQEELGRRLGWGAKLPNQFETIQL